MSIQELRKEQARNLRYKKPIAKGLNWQDIWDDLYEMYEGCTLVIWFMDDDKETLLESLNDDESEVEEYKIAFSTLEADCDQLMAALQEEWIPECFNVYRSYVGLRYRYDNLTAAMNFIKGEHTDYLGIVKRIEDLYEGACKEKGAYAKDTKAWRDFDRFAKKVPNEVWIV